MLNREILEQASLAPSFPSREYIAQVTITIVNRSDKALVGFAVGLWTADYKLKVYEERSQLSVAPGDPYVFVVSVPISGLLPGDADDLKMLLVEDTKDGKMRGYEVFVPGHGSFAGAEDQASHGTSDESRAVTADEAQAAKEGPPIVRKSGGALTNSAIQRVEPDYPPGAIAAKVSGAVVVEVLIGTDGVVESARAVSGPPLLADAAVVAAKQWRWNPPLVSGSPVRMIGTLTFGFAI